MKDPDKVIEEFMQRLITMFQDGFNTVPDYAEPLYLAAMQVFLSAVLPGLTPAGRELYDHLVGRSEAVVMPEVFDPRHGGLGVTEDKNGKD